MVKESLRTALLISGGGTTAEAVIRACQNGELMGIAPFVVIASQPSAPGLKKAQDLGVKTLVLSPKDFENREAWADNLLTKLKELNIDLVSQNGWLPLTPANVVEAYRGYIINQHPGPLDNGRPDFGGKGMYGIRVIAAVLIYHWLLKTESPWTEATTHHVTEEYDQGKLIRIHQLHLDPVQRLNGKIIQATQERLLPLEHQNVIATLQAFADDKVPTFVRETPLIPHANKDTLNEAKNIARFCYKK